MEGILSEAVQLPFGKTVSSLMSQRCGVEQIAFLLVEDYDIPLATNLEFPTQLFR